MHGSAQPEPSPELAPADNGAGLNLAAAGNAAKGEGDKANGNSSLGVSAGTNSSSDFVNDSSERRVLDEGELASTLQLLVERAQYITGATGTALALPQGEEMVCRASAGASAPAVGARLQVKSGLTGESMSRRQLLRCDNAEADPRVNLEACRALGIASIVVLPLLRKDGEVRGLFELFSDHPYAFEERDLIALERMAALTLTALDLAEQTQHLPSAPPDRQEKQDQVANQPIAAEVAKITTQESQAHQLVPESATVSALPEVVDADKAVPPQADAKETDKAPAIETIGKPAVEDISAEAQHKSSPTPEFRMPEPLVVKDLPPVLPSRDLDLGTLAIDTGNAETAVPISASTPVPIAMLRVQKCATCGFPVSEGRTLCLDCEKKGAHGANPAVNQASNASGPSLSNPATAPFNPRVEGASAEELTTPQAVKSFVPKKSDVEAAKLISPDIEIPATENQSLTAASGTTDSASADEFVPAFLANSAPYRESWLSKNYVNVLAGIVLILCILVAIVVFR